MRVLVIVFVLVLCGSCNDEPEAVPSKRPARSPIQAAPEFDTFERLSDRMMDIVVGREEFADTLKPSMMLPEEMTARVMYDALIEHQPYIERVIDATSEIVPPVPPEPEISEESIAADEHLNTVAGRLLNNSRLLLADAIRCWQDGEFEDCAERYAASFRIGLCMLNDADSFNNFRGSQAYIPSVFELDHRLADGLANHISDERCSELLQLLEQLDTSRITQWDDDAPVAHARNKAIKALQE